MEASKSIGTLTEKDQTGNGLEKDAARMDNPRQYAIFVPIQ